MQCLTGIWLWTFKRMHDAMGVRKRHVSGSTTVYRRRWILLAKSFTTKQKKKPSSAPQPPTRDCSLFGIPNESFWKLQLPFESGIFCTSPLSTCKVEPCTHRPRFTRSAINFAWQSVTTRWGSGHCRVASTQKDELLPIFGCDCYLR